VSDNGTCGDGRLGRPADAKQGGTVKTAENQPANRARIPRRTNWEQLVFESCPDWSAQRRSL